MVTNVQADLLQIKELEKTAFPRTLKSAKGLAFHLMPPVGWMNDPNGLCQLGGIYHIYFQYSPYNARGAYKYWGHYETKDFINYTYSGVVLSPDSKVDKDGVYSGSAIILDDSIYVYYTGNEKAEGDYDYVYEGREGNTVLVTSRDGRSFSEKELLLNSQNYPATLSCHVRDPKVFQRDGYFYMVLGARTKEDKGCVMLYRGTDPRNFTFVHFFETPEPFGFMWECPDLFWLGDSCFLSFSPQGLSSEPTRFQNIYQSGYLKLTGDVLATVGSISSISNLTGDASNSGRSNLAGDAKDSDALSRNSVSYGEFQEWDMGFDIYAPQTFLDERGRRILIGWMGIGDDSYSNPTVEEGWQHALTLPRELTLSADGNYILQNPIKELENLRKAPLEKTVAENGQISLAPNGPFELLVKSSCKDFTITFDRCMLFHYQASENMVSLYFLPDEECGPMDARGCGRRIRKAILRDETSISSLRILVDNSSIELFIGGGQTVMTSRYYRDVTTPHLVQIEGELEVSGYLLKPFSYDF